MAKSGGFIPFDPNSISPAGSWSSGITISGGVLSTAPVVSGASKEQEFGLIGFAAGVVTGARSFKVDKLGRLTGIHYPQVWKPGENLAECRKRDNFAGSAYLNGGGGGFTPPPDAINIQRDEDFVRMVTNLRYDRPNGDRHQVVIRDDGSWQEQVVARTPSKDQEHTIASCEHGFYAYYDGSDDYHKGGMVSGVVEGYGEALIGTRGFRCMKAKIVALTVSKDLAKPVAELVHRNYKDVPQFVTFEQMVKAYPTDHSGMQPAPDTDEDFWERSI